ncbi:hypothetical protein DIPPA_19413 [Diplonema papillatum]|nr:hypothetical protein DIPPA_19413 [Diplonema papillatum]
MTHFDAFRPLSASEMGLPKHTSQAEALYTPCDSRLRLERVRRVLDERQLDALLFIAGVDSRDNEGCIQAINYLLLGASGNELATPLLLDEDYEDTLLIVHKGGARVYTTPAAGEKVTRIVSSWPGLEMMALDARSYKNQDLFEEHKMASFRKMLRGLGTVGISVGDGADVMKIEKWPIIQSYALGTDGRAGHQGTFFTLSHAVTNVFRDLDVCFRDVMPHDLAAIVAVQRPLLSRHWDEVVAQFQRKSAGFLAEGEAAIAAHLLASEPDDLNTYFNYGAMRRQPQLVQWGVRAPAMAVGGGGAPPLHATLEAGDPQAPLAAARTVFLAVSGASGGGWNLDGFGGASALTKGLVPSDRVDAGAAAAVRDLTMLYAALVETVQRVSLRLCGGEGPAFGADQSADAKFARDTFSSVAALSGLDLEALRICNLADHLTVLVRHMDNGPFMSDILDISAVSPWRVTYVKLGLTGFSPRGDIVYGDTFSAAKSGGGGGRVVCLTESIGVYRGAAVQKAELQYSRNVEKAMARAEAAWEGGGDAEDTRRLLDACPLKAFIDTVSPATGGRMHAGVCRSGNELRGSASFFSNGAVFRDDHFGCLPPALFGTDITDVRIYNPPDLEETTVVCFTFSEDYPLWAPLHAAQHTARRCRGAGGGEEAGSGDSIAVYLQPGSAAKKEFVSKVYPVWKARRGVVRLVDGVPKTVPGELGGDRLLRFGVGLSDDKEHARAAKRDSGLQAFEDVKDYRPFSQPQAKPAVSKVDALKEAASIAQTLVSAGVDGWAPFDAAKRIELANWLVEGKNPIAEPVGLRYTPNGDPPASDDGTLVLDIVAGWFSTGKHKWVARLVNACDARNAAARAQKRPEQKVVAIGNTAEEGIEFDPMLFYRKLREARAAGAGRAVYTVPGCAPLPLVMHHVAQFAVKSPRPLRVNSATVLVHPDYVYVNNMSSPANFHLLPGFADQLTNGYVTQCLILSGGVDVNEVQSVVSGINDTCSFAYRPQDALEAVFDPPSLATPKHAEARRLSMCHVLHDQRMMSRLELVVVRFARLITTRYRINEYAAKVADSHSGMPGSENVLRMKALIHCDGQYVQVTAGKGKPFLTRTKVLGTDATLRHDQELMFIGFDLSEETLRREVEYNLLSQDSIVNSTEGIVHVSKSLKPKISVDSLQKLDIADINTSQHYRSLPAGWYFDGVCYVNHDGKTSMLRPDINVLMEEYVAKYNEEVDRHNKSISEQQQAKHHHSA